MEFSELAQAARDAREKAYAPYSHFTVGAALLTASGRVFTGCNVENLSFGLTICAERAAVCAAIAAGEKEFAAIFICSDSKEPVSPCGACRQVLSEFSDDMPITSINLQGQQFSTTLSVLLPRARTGILG